MRAITQRQAQVLEAIIGHLVAHHTPPTIRWLCDALGISTTNGMFQHLRALERKGFIERSPYAFGIKVLRFPDGAPLVLEVRRA